MRRSSWQRHRVATPKPESPARSRSPRERSITAPSGAPAGLLDLQHQAGNAAVGRLVRAFTGRSTAAVQAKLVVAAAQNRCEKEADRLADKVMRSWASLPGLRRDADEPVRPTAAATGADPPSAFEADSSVASRLAARRGVGRPLPAAVQGRMEDAFGADFNTVRVHADTEAGELSAGLHARAFTWGRDIYFGSGAYDPASRSGQHLLAHELTHVVQQGGSSQAARWVEGRSRSTAAQRLVLQRQGEDGAGHVLGGLRLPLTTPAADRELLNELRERARRPPAVVPRAEPTTTLAEVEGHLAESRKAMEREFSDYADRQAELKGLRQLAQEVGLRIPELGSDGGVSAEIVARVVGGYAAARLDKNREVVLHDGTSTQYAVSRALFEMQARTFQKDCKGREERRPEVVELLAERARLTGGTVEPKAIKGRCDALTAKATKMAALEWPARAVVPPGSAGPSGLPDDHLFTDTSTDAQEEAKEWIDARAKKRAIAVNSAKTAYRDALAQAGGGTTYSLGGQTIFHHSSGKKEGTDGCTLFVTRSGGGIRIVGIGWHDHTTKKGASSRYRLDWSSGGWASANVISL